MNRDVETHHQVIARLNARLDQVLEPHVRGISGYALLDFPDHSNVGDSAIWLGELAWLDRLVGRPPALVCAQEADWKALDAMPADRPILLHGGGNFGDIWPVHQRFRESVLDRYPDRLVIQMPQSIHFGDPATIERTAAAIRRHRRFVLLVRDETSFAFAQQHFDCVVELCPDAAFALGTMDRRAPTRDLLMLLRRDIEATGGADQPAGAEDWLEEPADTHRRARRDVILTSPGAALRLDRGALKRNYFEHLARRRVERGVRQLASARTIVSDRLHVHILSTLLGIPHALLDNSYGKIFRFATTWQSNWAEVKFATSLPEALGLADQLARDTADWPLVA